MSLSTHDPWQFNSAAAMDNSDAVDFPDNSESPGVHAKEIERIVLLQRRLGAARLNLGPFLGLYALLLAALVQQYIKNE